MTTATHTTHLAVAVQDPGEPLTDDGFGLRCMRSSGHAASPRDRMPALRPHSADHVT